MSETPIFIPLEEAIHISNQTKIELSRETLPLELANNRILGEDLYSKVDDPPFDNSAMDDYAMKFEDTINPPTKLEIIGTVQAKGQRDNITVKSGQAVRIMTGAPLPEGTDSILQIELTSRDENHVILNQKSMKNYVRKKGENLIKNKSFLKKGTLLTPSRIGLCATMGYPEIPVIKKLKIAIISTGDELKQPGQELDLGEIYESNSFGLFGLVKWLGHEPIRYQCIGDTIGDLREILDNASEDCDIIITSGGVSMGEWDFVRKLMEDEGDLHYWRVKIRPGSPPLFGLWRKTPIFGLPGNPVSSHVVFRMLVAPWIRNITSADGPIEPLATAKLTTKLKSSKDCLTFRRVSIELKENNLLAHQKIHQGSGNLASMAFSDGLAVLQPGREYKTGDIVQIMYL